MKTITDDAEGFFDQGGWNFLEAEDDTNNKEVDDDISDEEDDAYNPTDAEDEDGSEAGGSSESDDSEDYDSDASESGSGSGMLDNYNFSFKKNRNIKSYLKFLRLLMTLYCPVQHLIDGWYQAVDWCIFAN